MRTTIIIFLLVTGTVLGQTNLKNGIYRGRKFHLLECYLTLKDNNPTIEIFKGKNGLYIEHVSTVHLNPPKNNKTKNIVLTDNSDSFQVYKIDSRIKLRIKGIGSFKMQLTKMIDSDIANKINRSKDISYLINVQKEVKFKPNYNDSLYYSIYDSFNFKGFYAIDTSSFRIKCDQFKTQIKESWP